MKLSNANTQDIASTVLLKPEASEPEILEKFADRESLLKVNGQLIADLKKRVMARRFKPQAGDSIKANYARTMLQSIGLQASILKDIELDAIKKELEEVRELVKNQSCNYSSFNGRSK